MKSMTEKQSPTMMMTPDQLRALADALERLSLGTGKIGKAADYLRACADARLAASAIQTRLGERPIISGWDESTFKLNEEVALYTHPAPAAPQAELNDDEILDTAIAAGLRFSMYGDNMKTWATIKRLAREVERAHGIGGSDE